MNENRTTALERTAAEATWSGGLNAFYWRRNLFKSVLGHMSCLHRPCCHIAFLCFDLVVLVSLSSYCFRRLIQTNLQFSKQERMASDQRYIL